MKEKHDTCEKWDRNSRTRYTDQRQSHESALGNALGNRVNQANSARSSERGTKKMKTDKKIPSCQNCAYYRAFYNEGNWDFWEQKTGLCAKCEKIVGEKERANRGVLIKKSRRRNRLLTSGEKYPNPSKNLRKAVNFPRRA